MERYLEERCRLFNEGSEFSCPDFCGRYGCKEPDLHITISLVDLVAVSLVSKRRVSDLFNKVCKVGFDPLNEKDPWVGRISIELKKPCPFLDEKKCRVYSGRPIACALFPEAFFFSDASAGALKKEIFRKFPCVHSPVHISPLRKEMLGQLMQIYAQEIFLSDFFLFGVSPFLVDLKNIAGEGLQDVQVSEGGKARMPYHKIGGLLEEKLSRTGYWRIWENKMLQLDEAESLNEFWKTKKWTDEMARVGRGPLAVAYQFDGDRLRPVHIQK
jgi:Fe-S-cluster containining protein